MNRATADNQSAQSEEEGLEPTKEWVKDLVDEIVAEEFASPDLELHWLDEEPGGKIPGCRAGVGSRAGDRTSFAGGRSRFTRIEATAWP